MSGIHVLLITRFANPRRITQNLPFASRAPESDRSSVQEIHIHKKQCDCGDNFAKRIVRNSRNHGEHRADEEPVESRAQEHPESCTLGVIPIKWIHVPKVKGILVAWDFRRKTGFTPTFACGGN